MLSTLFFLAVLVQQLHRGFVLHSMIIAVQEPLNLFWFCLDLGDVTATLGTIVEHLGRVAHMQAYCLVSLPGLGINEETGSCHR